MKSDIWSLNNIMMQIFWNILEMIAREHDLTPAEFAHRMVGLC